MGSLRLVVVLKHPQESLDYVPQMGQLARKLARRFWPGPVTLLFDESRDRATLESATLESATGESATGQTANGENKAGDALPRGLAGALPADTYRELLAADGLALRVPAHELTWNVLRLLPSPR